MHRRKKFRIAIFAVAAITLVMAMSGHGQQAAWMNGYSTGIAAAASTGADGAAAAAPMVAHAQMAHHGMHSGFGLIGAIIGGIFRLGFFLLMFVLFAKMFGLLMWRLSGQAGGPPWGYHGPGAKWQGKCGDGQSGKLGWAGQSEGGRDGWNRDEMRKKWQERKRAWAKEAGWDNDAAEAESSNDGSDQRPPEERFVV